MNTRWNMGTAMLLMLPTLLLLTSCSGAPETAQTWRELRDSQFVPVEKFLAITNGMQFGEVKEVLGNAIRHQFTVQYDGHTMTLVLCFIHTGEEQSYNFYQLLFQDEALLKTIGWIRMEREEYPYRGTTATRQKPWDIDDMKYVKRAVEAPAVTPDQIRTEIMSAQETMRHHKGEGNIPEFVGRLFAPAFRRKAKEGYSTNEKLRRTFDGCRVSIGMAVSEVDDLYGEPLHTFDADTGGAVRIYGDDRYFGNAVDAPLVFPYVAVLFGKDGRVVSVYSDSFFCNQWYPKMPSWRND